MSGGVPGPARRVTRFAIMNLGGVDETLLPATAVAAAAGVSLETLARLVRHGLIEPDAPGGDHFAIEEMVRLRRMLRLHDDLGVNLTAAAIILDLVERLAAVEHDRERDFAAPGS